jgi:hypothetical protein
MNELKSLKFICEIYTGGTAFGLHAVKRLKPISIPPPASDVALRNDLLLNVVEFF